MKRVYDAKLFKNTTTKLVYWTPKMSKRLDKLLDKFIGHIWAS